MDNDSFSNFFGMQALIFCFFFFSFLIWAQNQKSVNKSSSEFPILVLETNNKKRMLFDFISKNEWTDDTQILLLLVNRLIQGSNSDSTSCWAASHYREIDYFDTAAHPQYQAFDISQHVKAF